MQGTCGFLHSVLSSLDFSEWIYTWNLWFLSFSFELFRFLRVDLCREPVVSFIQFWAL